MNITIHLGSWAIPVIITIALGAVAWLYKDEDPPFMRGFVFFLMAIVWIAYVIYMIISTPIISFSP